MCLGQFLTLFQAVLSDLCGSYVVRLRGAWYLLCYIGQSFHDGAHTSRCQLVFFIRVRRPTNPTSLSRFLRAPGASRKSAATWASSATCSSLRRTPTSCAISATTSWTTPPRPAARATPSAAHASPTRWGCPRRKRGPPGTTHGWQRPLHAGEEKSTPFIHHRATRHLLDARPTPARSAMIPPRAQTTCSHLCTCTREICAASPSSTTLAQWLSHLPVLQSIMQRRASGASRTQSSSAEHHPCASGALPIPRRA